MINKLLTFVFVGSLTAASAQDFTISGIHYNITSADGATEKTVEIGRTSDDVSSCYNGNLVLNSTVTDSSTDYTITSIASSAFKRCSTLMSVILPNSVTSIENNAFASCANLASVILPNSITNIGVGSFGFCTKLTNITLPNTLMRLEQAVFVDCTSLTSITLPNTLTSIMLDAFRGTGLTSITLPNSITSIGNNAFASCTNLASVILPNSITSIEVGTFSFCAKLTNVTLPNTLMELEQSAFQNCTSLTSIILPNSITSIGLSAFSDSGLTSITLPNSITSIGNTAFNNCTALTTVAINKATPLTIDASVFSGVTLSGITLKVPMGSDAAYESATVWSGFDRPTEEIDFEFTKAGINYVITNTETPTTVAIIGRESDAASGAFAVTEVANADITYAITSIATGAFENCSDLTGFTFPSTITSISPFTFKDCMDLATVTLHDNIREIGNNAFENCTGLTGFTFPDNNNFTSVAESTFKGCTGLTTVTLPNSSIASIGDDAFKGCSGLTTFSINKAMPLAIAANVFLNVTLSAVTLNVPVGSDSAYEGADVWSDFGTTVGDASLPPILFTISGVNYEITSVEDRTVEIAASSCYDVAGGVFALTEVVNSTITYAITSIAANAFEGCIGLTGFTFPDNNNFTSIAEAVFKGCTGLTTVTLPNFFHCEYWR